MNIMEYPFKGLSFGFFSFFIFSIYILCPGFSTFRPHFFCCHFDEPLMRELSFLFIIGFGHTDGDIKNKVAGYSGK